MRAVSHSEIFGAFRVFDPEGTGYVSREIFVDILMRDREDGLAVGRERAEAIFERLDTNHNGVVMYARSSPTSGRRQ